MLKLQHEQREDTSSDPTGDGRKPSKEQYA